jgi:hypothetical protein
LIPINAAVVTARYDDALLDKHTCREAGIVAASDFHQHEADLRARRDCVRIEMMVGLDTDAVMSRFLASLDSCDTDTYPFRHWQLDRMLPADICAAIDALPVVPPLIEDTHGKRETHNSTRIFFRAHRFATPPRPHRRPDRPF